MGTSYTQIIEVIQVEQVSGNDSVVLVVFLLTEIPPTHKVLNYINDVPVEYKFSQKKPCTLDAYVCPNGGVVGRDPQRNCEFKPCAPTPTPSKVVVHIEHLVLALLTTFAVCCISICSSFPAEESGKEKKEELAETELQEVPVETGPPPVNFNYYYTPVNQQELPASIYEPNPYASFTRKE